MNTIERVRKWCRNRLKIYGYIDFGPLNTFLYSLSQERCVWKASDSPYYYWELSCHGGGSNDQANTSWEYCPYCGKRIEVKEADNG